MSNNNNNNCYWYSSVDSVYPIYISLCTYYPQIVLISLLSVITIFRRNLSCNSVYLDTRTAAGDEDDDGSNSPRNNATTSSRRSGSSTSSSMLTRMTESHPTIDGDLQQPAMSGASWLTLGGTRSTGQRRSGGNIRMGGEDCTDDDMDLVSSMRSSPVPTTSSTTTSSSSATFPTKDTTDLSCTAASPPTKNDTDSHAAPKMAGTATANRGSRKDSGSSDVIHPCLMECLPQDIQLKCFTYLHPKDVVILGCVNRHLYNLVHCEEAVSGSLGSLSFAGLLWYRLFLRDYAWVVCAWKYGKEAVYRSRWSYKSCWRCPKAVKALFHFKEEEEKVDGGGGNHDLYGTTKMDTNDTKAEYVDESNMQHTQIQGLGEEPVGMKEFYLVFGQTWLEYCIAGRTQNPTLVGLHGHVFNLTSFLDLHPGSSETLIMQGAGKNSTAFFESVGHSKHARSLAMDKMVEVIDLSCCCRRSSSCSGKGLEAGGKGGGGGRLLSAVLSPPPIGLVSPQSTHGRSITDMLCLLPHKRTNKRVVGPGTLVKVRQRLEKERMVQERVIYSFLSSKTMSNRGDFDIVGNVNVYFDPICFCWKAWYLNLDFEPVFLHNIHPPST